MFAQTEATGVPMDPIDELEDLLAGMEKDVKSNPDKGLDKKAIKGFILKTV